VFSLPVSCRVCWSIAEFAGQLLSLPVSYWVCRSAGTIVKVIYIYIYTSQRVKTYRQLEQTQTYRLTRVANAQSGCGPSAECKHRPSLGSFEELRHYQNIGKYSTTIKQANGRLKIVLSQFYRNNGFIELSQFCPSSVWEQWTCWAVPILCWNTGFIELSQFCVGTMDLLSCPNSVLEQCIYWVVPILSQFCVGTMDVLSCPNSVLEQWIVPILF
jgi:hypothetical protein